jgi:transcriptional regulator with XRE-family HTH domain
VVFLYHKPLPKLKIMKTFGEYIFDLRRKNRITLREFCRITNSDPSNWSKVERGILQPPKSNEVLDEMAKALKLEKGTEEYNLLFDLAAIAFIPRNLVLQDEEMLDKLPIFFRTLRGNKPTEEELETILKLLKEG